MFFSSYQKELLRWFLGVALTTSSIFALAFYNDPHTTSSSRAPASVPPEKKAEPSPEKTSMLKSLEGLDNHRMGKGNGLVEIEIHAGSKRSLTSSASQEVEAVVHAQADLTDLEFAWLLPDGVTAVSGALTGQIGNLQSGQETTLTLQLSSSTTENRRVHLHVYRMINGEAMGQMTQFNTVDQAQIDDNLNRKAQALDEKASESPVKMMQ